MVSQKCPEMAVRRSKERGGRPTTHIVVGHWYWSLGVSNGHIKIDQEDTQRRIQFGGSSAKLVSSHYMWSTSLTPRKVSC